MRGVIRLRLAGAAVAVLLLLSGCMGGRTITVDIGYDQTRSVGAPFAEGEKVKVALVPFKASGGVNDTLGKWVGFRGREDTLKASAPPEEAVTEAAFDYMRKAGLDVMLAPAGASVESYSEGSPDLVMGGTIEELKMAAVSKFGSTAVTASFRMKVLLRNVKDSSLLTVNVEGASEPRTIVAFDSKVFKETVNGVVSESVEKIFKNTVIKDGLLRPAP